MSHDLLLARRVAHPVVREPDEFARAMHTITPAAEPAVVFTSLAELSVQSFSDSCEIVVSEVGGIAYRIQREKHVHGTAAGQPYHPGLPGAGGNLRTGFVSRATSADAAGRHPSDEGIGAPQFAGVVAHRWHDVGHPTAVEIGMADMAVQHAVLTIVQERLADAIRIQHSLLDALTRESECNVAIAAAVGVLMASFQLTQANAFDRLQATSQRSNRAITDVAAEVLSTGALKT